ncbi:MAG: A/G-specific adenine glycosylase [Lewinella sp.]|uniref:A/G-specific adenine glycosylase n=1 Tax=Lewinella sp. TaxID=2004506 RepID=UPI003D6B1FC8
MITPRNDGGKTSFCCRHFYFENAPPSFQSAYLYIRLMASSSFPFFTRTLLDWYEPERRPLAWKHITDPYLIWLSEIILQQTRAEQGAPYFQKFSECYPTVSDLARAAEDEVMKMWEGLGYYSRARNLHAAAKFIHTEYGGVFPDDYERIRALKGVGPYTAAAIASFAFQLPYAVVDGNVYRLLSRFFDDATPIDISQGIKHFAGLAQELLPKDSAATYNQAMMDMGATICTPKKPLCEACPLNRECQGLANGTITERPVKVKKLKRSTRYFNYLVVQHPDFRMIEKRTAKDIWRNLYQFPLVETKASLDTLSQLLEEQSWPDWLLAENLQLIRKLGPRKQELTHQRIIADFWEFKYIGNRPDRLPEGINLIKPENCSKFAFPKVISWYFDDNSLYLF